MGNIWDKLNGLENGETYNAFKGEKNEPDPHRGQEVKKGGFVTGIIEIDGEQVEATFQEVGRGLKKNKKLKLFSIDGQEPDMYQRQAFKDGQVKQIQMPEGYGGIEY